MTICRSRDLEQSIMSDQTICVHYGKSVNGSDYDEVGWKGLKRTYTIGDFTTICLACRIVPNRSQATRQITGMEAIHDEVGFTWTPLCGDFPHTMAAFLILQIAVAKSTFQYVARTAFYKQKLTHVDIHLESIENWQEWSPSSYQQGTGQCKHHLDVLWPSKVRRYQSAFG